MKRKPFFPFPKETYGLPYKDLYLSINSADSTHQEKEASSNFWISHVNCYRGSVLEKATWSSLHIVHGTVNDKPGSISRFETVAYPSNPQIPALFVMADMNETKDMGRYLVFFADLIIQDGQAHKTEKQLFASPLENICHNHGQDFEEHNSFITGRGVFGGCAGECGLMGFFEEKDIPFLEALLQVIPSSYQQVIESGSDISAEDADYEKMYLSRARFVEWMITENIGVKVLRENNIPLSIIEASCFPPVVRY
jgi:hypothetical protein